MYVQLNKGVVRWYYNLMAENGQVLATSQRYYSKGNAVRAAKRLAEVTNTGVRYD